MLLTEGLQTVYHACSYESLMDILTTNTIELSPTVAGAERSIDNKYFYFLSTMRTKSGKYFLGTDRNTNHPNQYCYIELDADALSHNIKHMPVDYWQMGPKAFEEEERWFSNRDKIINADKFIKSIHVLTRTKHNHQGMFDTEPDYRYRDVFKDDATQKLYDLYMNAEKFKKIPTYFYDEPQNYVLGKNPIEIEFPSDMYTNVRPDKDGEIVDAIIKFYGGDQLTQKELKRIRELVDYNYGFRQNEIVREIEDEVHRYRKATSDKLQRVKVKQFVDLMKKARTSNVSDFVKEFLVPDLKAKLTKKESFVEQAQAYLDE